MGWRDGKLVRALSRHTWALSFAREVATYGNQITLQGDTQEQLHTVHPCWPRARQYQQE